MTSLLTELTQVRELQPLPAGCSMIADFIHSPGLLRALGGGLGGGREGRVDMQSSGSSRDSKFIEHFPWDTHIRSDSMPDNQFNSNSRLARNNLLE